MLLTLVNYMFFPIAMKLWWVFGFVVSFITFFLMTFVSLRQIDKMFSIIYKQIKVFKYNILQYKHERDKLKETVSVDLYLRNILLRLHLGFIVNIYH